MARAATARTQPTSGESPTDLRRVGDLTVAELEQVISGIVAGQLAGWTAYLIDEIGELVDADPDALSEAFEAGLAQAIEQVKAGETVTLETVERQLGL